MTYLSSANTHHGSDPITPLLRNRDYISGEAFDVVYNPKNGIAWTAMPSKDFDVS
jgi:mono/diheme cytochrome c family protein